VDAADWIRRELAGPLDYFGLTMNEFRLLHMLYNQGPMTMSDAAERRACKIQNMEVGGGGEGGGGGGGPAGHVARASGNTGEPDAESAPWEAETWAESPSGESDARRPKADRNGVAKASEDGEGDDARARSAGAGYARALVPQAARRRYREILPRDSDAGCGRGFARMSPHASPIQALDRQCSGMITIPQQARRNTHG